MRKSRRNIIVTHEEYQLTQYHRFDEAVKR
jgi:hypothetical protein